MKKFLLMAKIVVLGMSIVEIGYADNDPSAINNWTGLYVGVNTGVIFNTAQLSAQQLGFTNSNDNYSIKSDFATFFPGIQLGYTYQFSNFFAAGIEANLTVNTNPNDTINYNCSNNSNVYDRFVFKNQLQSSIKARGGQIISWNKNILFAYLTTGASFANLDLIYENEAGDYYSKNTHQPGWLIGAGIEWFLKTNLSLRAEYTYMNYGNAIMQPIPSIYGLKDPNGSAHIDLSTNTIMIAISYWM